MPISHQHCFLLLLLLLQSADDAADRAERRLDEGQSRAGRAAENVKGAAQSGWFGVKVSYYS